MSSFNNKGLRKDKIRTQVKHLNSFHEILDHLEIAYQNIIKYDEAVNNDNIDRISALFMGRELDSIEMMVMRGKLGLETKLKRDEQGDNV